MMSPKKPLDPLEPLLGYHIRRLSLLVMFDLSAALAPQQISPVSASILLCIGATPGVTQSHVGRALGILRANMAPLIGALAERGLIARARVDGRSQALSLSSAGQALCQKIKSIIQAHEDRMFGSLSASERRQLATVLHRLWRSRA
jgi:DNA-binding MarR family transcriptional regulator